jgi:hypothetical protein
MKLNITLTLDEAYETLPGYRRVKVSWSSRGKRH